METKDTLPNFSEQLAVVYDDYLDTLGGGERSAFAYAKALQTLGFTTSLVTERPPPRPSEVERTFGSEFSDVSIEHIRGPVGKSLDGTGLSVFVNHTFTNFERNPAKIGIYSQMFPLYPVNRLSHPVEWGRLKSYQLMLCNSSFTQNYTEGYWELPKTKVSVLHPPIGDKFVSQARANLINMPKKAKTIVSVGRFNPGAHNKNQKILIEAFIEARKRHTELHAWRFHLIGNVNKDSASQSYFRDCMKLADSCSAVKILSDVAQPELESELQQAFGYAHATGAFSKPGESPFQCEHLGLSIMEAMAYGCLPLVYGRGGIFDIARPFESAIPYFNKEELIKGFITIAKSYESSSSSATQKLNCELAAHQSQESFTNKLAGIISNLLTKDVQYDS